ncbi:AAA family ATPase [Orbaceae bacterium ESL0721]|nr:AAA family ATPase [Orbaceae bacterium ESL0721]
MEYRPKHFRQVIKSAIQGLVGREQLAELIILSIIAKEHLLVIGPPGTAKSAVVRRMAKAVQGDYFEYLLGRFTEPTELFGAVDLKQLREGQVEIDTTGMLPEADIAFLDEVFLGSTAILNTLLGILNERVFRKGHTQINTPLKVCIAASNSLPEDEALDAFADRFLIHLFIDSIEDHAIEDLLKGGWQSEHLNLDMQEITLDEIVALGDQLTDVDLDEVIPIFADAIRELRKNGIVLSDRRTVKTLKLIAAAALLNGRKKAEKQDLWPLYYVLPTEECQQKGQILLKEYFVISQNSQLFNAVEAASLQPASREERLIQDAEKLLQIEATKVNRLDVESLLREIDANYSTDTITDRLLSLRKQLVNLVS